MIHRGSGAGSVAETLSLQLAFFAGDTDERELRLFVEPAGACSSGARALPSIVDCSRKHDVLMSAMSLRTDSNRCLGPLPAVIGAMPVWQKSNPQSC